MKTIALIKNELFENYLKIVSTTNLEETLDDPSVPVPFTCLRSANNNNADALVKELYSYFANSRLKGKDFLKLNESEQTQLDFMINLITLSSGQEGTISSSKLTSSVENTEVVTSVPIETIKPQIEEKIVTQPAVNVELPEEEDPFTIEENKIEESSEKVDHIVENKSIESEEDPFDPFAVPETLPVETKVEEKEEVSSENLIPSLGIPVNSVIHFAKDKTITALLVDEKTVILDGETLPIADAAKIAFKKSGTLGMATAGLSNWFYNGVNVKTLLK